MPRSNVDIFQFLDYRTYLRAFYDAEKASSSTFSYRAFSMRAGLASPNHLKRIMDGERSLQGELDARNQALRQIELRAEQLTTEQRAIEARLEEEREDEKERVRREK